MQFKNAKTVSWSPTIFFPYCPQAPLTIYSICSSMCELEREKSQVFLGFLDIGAHTFSIQLNKAFNLFLVLSGNKLSLHRKKKKKKKSSISQYFKTARSILQAKIN